MIRGVTYGHRPPMYRTDYEPGVGGGNPPQPVATESCVAEASSMPSMNEPDLLYGISVACLTIFLSAAYSLLSAWMRGWLQ